MDIADFHVLPYGTEVMTNIASVKAVITAVCIRFQVVTYEVTYYHEGEFKVVWLGVHQFKVMAGSQTQIVGFGGAYINNLQS